MKITELSTGARFQYKQQSRWSNHFRVAEIISWPELNNIFIKTTAGRSLILDKNTEIRIEKC